MDGYDGWYRIFSDVLEINLWIVQENRKISPLTGLSWKLIQNMILYIGFNFIPAMENNLERYLYIFS